MKLKQYLTESIDSKTRRFILKTVNDPQNGKVGNIKAKQSGNSVTFTYPEDEFDVTMFITDLVDSMKGVWFETKPKKGVMNFTVYTKDKNEKNSRVSLGAPGGL